MTREAHRNAWQTSPDAQEAMPWHGWGSPLGLWSFIIASGVVLLDVAGVIR
jgi:hypothetical protein